MQKTKILFTLILLMIPSFALGAEEVEIGQVVVTATRTEEAISSMPSSVTVITADDIEKKQAATVYEVLRQVTGLDVVQNGGMGQNTNIFIRGANSEHTLVMIDGVEMNDPISTGRAFNFTHLTVDNIERIEIIRGPQSTLYGSDAIGGVINIITKKGKGHPSFVVSGEAGSYGTYKEYAELSGATENYDYAIGISHLDTKGFSSARDKDGNSEEDGYENTSFSGSIGINPTDHFGIDITGRYIDGETELDNRGGPGGDDPNYITTTKQLFFRTAARLYLLDELWEQVLGVSVTENDRNSQNDVDVDHPSDLSRSTYESQLLKVDWQNNFYLNESNTLTVGLETEKEEGKSDYYSESALGPYTNTFEQKNARTSGYYIQEQYKLQDLLSVTAGIRLDDHDRFGSETTYRLAAAYLLKKSGTKIKATYGTGFKAPSLFQLFDPANGNKDLKPEESKGWDAGVEQVLWNERIKAEVSYFHNEFDELIEWTLVDPIFFTGIYTNVAKAESKGAELTMTLQPIDELTFQANYTYTKTEDKTTGENLLRRPKRKFTANINYTFNEKGNINMGVIYVGKRDDNDPVSWGTRVELDSYTLANCGISYNVTSFLELFGRIENLANREYEEVKGYGTAGRSYYGGLKATF